VVGITLLQIYCRVCIVENIWWRAQCIFYVPGGSKMPPLDKIQFTDNR